MTEDKITVITTVYNTSVEYLMECVLSVSRQTYENHEHIIVDDGSTDKSTLAYLKELEEQDKRIKVVFEPKNRGIGESRNRGIELASGEYLCFLDSDDYYKETFLQALYEPIRNDHEVDMVIDAGYSFHGVENISTRNNDIDEKYYSYSAPTGCRLFRRDMLVDNNVEFPTGRKIYEDNTFFVAATIEARKISRICEYGYVNRINPNSYSHSPRYTKLKYEDIPLEYINNHILARVNKNDNTISSNKYDIILSACLMMLATCVLILSRRCDRDEQHRNIVDVSGIIREVSGGQCSRYIKEWNRRTEAGRLEQILFNGFARAVDKGYEEAYTKLIHMCFRICGK